MGEFTIDVAAGTSVQSANTFTFTPDRPVAEVSVGITGLEIGYLFGSDHLEAGNEFITVSRFFTETETNTGASRINLGRAQFDDSEATTFQSYAETIDISVVVADNKRFLQNIEFKYVANNVPRPETDDTELKVYVDDFSITAVPKPGSMLLLSIGGLMLLRKS